MVKIQDLSAALVDKYGLSKKDAEHFITQMFALIAEELHTSQTSVKVKGLGTFKVTSVSSRESVDVNSGERIVINGHNKITFTPDVAMRDRVNHPFVQFETVILNDGVDFSEIDAKNAEETENVEPLETEENRTEDAIPEIETEQQSPLDEAKPQNEVAIVDTEISTPLVTIVEEQNESQEVEIVDSSKNSEAEQTSSPVVDDTPTQEENSFEEETPGGFLHVKCMKICCLSVVVAVIFCCICFGFYYLYDQLQLRNQRIATLEKEVKQMVVANKEANENLAQKDSATIIDVNEAIANTNRNIKTDSVKPQTVPTAEKTAEYDSDPRLRTGAYTIIGVDRTVVVRKGQTVESISKTYLGPGMECYVEALNSYKTVAEGDSLKIPKLKLKKQVK